MNLFRFIPLFLLSVKKNNNIVFNPRFPQLPKFPKFEFNEKIMMETIMVNL